ncbi:MAG TPA: hypothetical protein VFN74_17500 [Chloroflexota bacterium]|nr:hypothetical protein [Chloroflexota bacterium]
MRRAPAPIGDGAFYLYRPEQVEESLHSLAVGAPATRSILVPDTLPDEKDVRAIERQMRTTYMGRGRRALGWGMWWLFAAPALALAIANLLPVLAVFFGWLPPLAMALATLGASTGGVVLGFAVTLAPLGWGWSRAVRDLKRAARWRGLARVAQRRLRTAPLRQEQDPALAAFAQEAEAPLNRLREALNGMAERGVDAAGEGAAQARSIAQLAARHGLPEVAQAYHALYARLSIAERRLGPSEGGSVLAERRSRGEASKAQRAAREIFAPFRIGHRPPASPLAPYLGAGAGVLALALALALTGLYLVPDGAALLIEGVASRAARVVRAGAAQPGAVVRGPASGWSLPFPLTGRRYLSLEPRVISIFSRLRPVGDAAYDIVEVRISYRISDVERWAQLDADGDGERQIALVLSQQLDEFIGERRQTAAQQVAMENPNLANNPQAVFERVDASLAQNLEALIRIFMTQGAPQLTQGAGVQVSPQFQFQPRQAVDAQMVEAILGQER